MNSFGDDINSLQINETKAPTQPGQLEYLHGLMQSLQRGAVDPEEHDKQMKQSNFTLLKKAGLLTLLYILLTLGCVHRGAAYLMESGFIRKSVFSLIFFVIAFIIIRFM